MKRKGFTLVELLVVIAIIGILATVVLVNLNAARNKAKDAAIKATLSEARIAAEMWYDGDGGGSYDGFCGSTDAGRIMSAVESQYPTTPTAWFCDNDALGTPPGRGWCAEYNLTTTGEQWCVDARGSSGKAEITCAAGQGCNGVGW